MEKNKQKQFKDCDLCNRVNATCLCFKCYSYFCESCYKVIHDIKKDPQHKKENIDSFVPIDVKCPDHPDHPVYLFCAEEKGN